MSAAILQNGRPVACWSRKLNSTQKNYTTMEKGLLAVVMCLKEFQSMLIGANLTIFTDHHNITFRTMNPQSVLRWKIYLEDFPPDLMYIEVKNNVLADYFSRLSHPNHIPPSDTRSSTRPATTRIPPKPSSHFKSYQEKLNLFSLHQSNTQPTARDLSSSGFKRCREMTPPNVMEYENLPKKSRRNSPTCNGTEKNNSSYDRA